MKQINYNSVPVFPFQGFMIFTMVLLIAISGSCCFLQFYKTNTTHKTNAVELGELQDLKKYFIVHAPAGIFSLGNIGVTTEVLTGSRVPLYPEHAGWVNPVNDYGNRFLINQKANVLNEVHLYTNGSYNSGGLVQIPIRQINRMDVYALDKKFSGNTAMVGWVGFTLGLSIIAVAAGLAVKGETEDFVTESL